MYKHICEYCKKEYEIPQYRENKIISGKTKHCFCCKNCYDAFQSQIRIQCSCEHCGKIIFKTPYRYNMSQNHFCSHKCADEYRRLILTEERFCPICGSSFRTGKNSSKTYCSMKCQGRWQSTQIGKTNPRYRRVESKCEWCSKPIDVKRYLFNNGQLKFCNENCRRKWYSEVFSQSNDWKESSRNRILKEFEDGVISTVNSKPQRILDLILDSMNIEYQREKNIKYYSIDNYIESLNLFIEVQGDYWHCNPKIFQQISLQQKDRITKDKAKHTYVLNHYGTNILYLWESDLYHSFHLCESLIKEFINNNGMLKNYNSFNYHLEDDRLTLNDVIIYSYQEKNIDEYKTLIQAS